MALTLKYKLHLLLSVSCLSFVNTSLWAMDPPLGEDKEFPKTPLTSSSSTKKQDSSQIQLEDKIIEALDIVSTLETDAEQPPSNALNVGVSVSLGQPQKAPYSISQSKARDLCGWDLYGFVKSKENALGNHRVASRGNAHFKLSPGGGYGDEGAINDIRPGMEFCVSSLFHLLTTDPAGHAITRIAPSSTLLVLNNIKIKNIEGNSKIPHSPYLWVREKMMKGDIQCVEDFLNQNPGVKDELESHGVEAGKRAVFQVSETIDGQILNDVLRNPESYRALCEHLDPTNFSSLFMGTLLTQASDGGYYNYIVYKLENKHTEDNKYKFGIACIDNDESFVCPIERLKSGKHFPNVKAVPFFLPMMAKEVDEKFKRLFLEKPPEILLYQWIQTLDNQNKNYKTLLTRGALSQKTLQNMFLPIRLKPGLLKDMYTKVGLIQKLLRGNPTHEDILKEVEPLLYQYYKTLQGKSPRDLLNLVSHDKDAYEHLLNLVEENYPFPVIGMNILQAGVLGGLLPFEALIPHDDKLHAQLKETVFQKVPDNFEEYEQKTIPLVESLQELINAGQGESVGESIFNHALQTQNKKALSFLTSQGIGSPQQMIEALQLDEIPLKHIYFNSKVFSDNDARDLWGALVTRKDLKTLKLKTNYRTEQTSPSIGYLGLETILDGIKKITSLTSLAIEGYDIRNFSLGLQTLPHLKSLCFSYTELKNDTALMIAKQAPYVERLELSANHIKASGMGEILKNLKNLKVLNLSRNKTIMDSRLPDHTFFLEELKKRPSLTLLDVSHANVTNKTLDLLGEALKDHPTVTALNLNYNGITYNESLKGIELLISNPKLQDLNLGKNNIKDNGTLILANVLRQNKGNLTLLDLSYNRIGEQGAKSLKHILQYNTPLKSLNLVGNSFGNSDGIFKIIKGLAHNTTLTSLNLAYTEWTPSQIQINNFFEILKHNYTLEHLNISGKTDEIIPREILLSQLKQINTRRNVKGFPPLNIVYLLEEQARGSRR